MSTGDQPPKQWSEFLEKKNVPRIGIKKPSSRQWAIEKTLTVEFVRGVHCIVSNNRRLQVAPVDDGAYPQIEIAGFHRIGDTLQQTGDAVLVHVPIKWFLFRIALLIPGDGRVDLEEADIQIMHLTGGSPLAKKSMSLFEDLSGKPKIPNVAAIPIGVRQTWERDRQQGESAPDFIIRVYGRWIGKGLAQADLRKDRKLYSALMNWKTQNGNELPFYLPTKKLVTDKKLNEKYGEDSQQTLKELERAAAAIRRRLAAKNTR